MSERPPVDGLQVPTQPHNQRLVSNNSVYSVARRAGRLTSPEDLLVGDGAVSQRAADLLGHALDTPTEDVQPPSQNNAKFPESEAPLGVDERPWYRRPSAWWILPISMFSAFIFGGTIAPRTEIYIKLACAKHRPEYYSPFPDLPIPPVVNYTTGPIQWFDITHPGSPPLLWQRGTGVLTPLASVQPLPAINLPQGGSRCSTDPVVLAAVAKLVTVTTLIIGILTCLVTGWWGQLSDSRGRTFVWGFAISGALVSEITLILVTFFHDKLPGGYWFLAVASVIDGLLGGLATSTATSHAYISDCTEPSSRSRIFSLALGLVFVGISAGPALGGFLISQTNDLLTPFYIGILGHSLLITIVWAVLPESLSPEAMERLAQQRDLKAKEEERTLAMRGTQVSSLAGVMLSWFLRAGRFLAPLAIFLPRERQGHGKGKDWNLTYFVAAYWIVVSYIALYPIKLQYAIASFGWSSIELSYWLSVVGITRGVHLIVLLPVAIKIFKPKSQPVALPIEPGEPLHTSSTQPSSPPSPDTGGVDSEPATEPPPSSYPAPPGLPPHVAAHFDLQVARISLLLDILGYITLSLCGSSGFFLAATVMGSMASGFSPSAQSLALLLATPSDGSLVENGKTFGALAVVQALGSQILGPALFGSVYINTVGVHPKIIFIVATGGACIAMVLLLLIRIPKAPGVASPEEGMVATVNEQRSNSDNRS